MESGGVPRDLRISSRDSQVRGVFGAAGSWGSSQLCIWTVPPNNAWRSPRCGACSARRTRTQTPRRTITVRSTPGEPLMKCSWKDAMLQCILVAPMQDSCGQGESEFGVCSGQCQTAITRGFGVRSLEGSFSGRYNRGGVWSWFRKTRDPL